MFKLQNIFVQIASVCQIGSKCCVGDGVARFCEICLPGLVRPTACPSRVIIKSFLVKTCNGMKREKITSPQQLGKKAFGQVWTSAFIIRGKYLLKKCFRSPLSKVLFGRGATKWLPAILICGPSESIFEQTCITRS